MKKALQPFALFAVFFLGLVPPSFAQTTAIDSTQKISENNVFKRNRIAGGAGLSYFPGFITSRSPEKLDDHFQSLRTGFNFGLEVSRFQANGFGIGVKYWGFRSSASTEVPVVSTTGEEIIELAEDKISTHFIGAVLHKRLTKIESRNALTVSVFLGQTYFENEGSFLTSYEINGSGGSVGISADFEHQIDNNLRFFASGGLAAGKMRKYELRTELQTVEVEPGKEKYGSLAQLGLTAGLRYYW